MNDLGFEFWITTDEFQMRLPITPEKYEINTINQMEIIRSASIGDVNLLGPIAPTNILLQGVFTTNKYDFAKPPTLPISKTFDYITYLEKMQLDKKHCRVIIASESGTKINKPFYLESIYYSEDNTTNGDINFELKFREFIQMKTEITTASTRGSSARPVGNPPPKPKTHTVLSGDNLSKIARKYYGNPDWKKIYNANIDVIGKNPNIIYAGQVLKIP